MKRIQRLNADHVRRRTEPRIIYNDDTGTLRNLDPPHSIDCLDRVVDYLANTQVDCFCWLMTTQIAYSWKSQVMENVYDRKERAIDSGSLQNNQRDATDSLYRQGIDYLPFLIKRIHAHDMTFIASFRMNDTHHKSSPDGILAPEFWKRHQDWRIWDATEAKSYYNSALDYSYPEVRNRYRDTIAEVIAQYDVDGIELDFTRSPYFFQPSEAWRKRKTLTRYVVEIANLLKQASKGREHPYMLILRVPCNPRVLRTAGIDLGAWIDQRLAPILVISELSNDYNQDLTPWLARSRQAGVHLYPAVEKTPAFNIQDFYTSLPRNLNTPRHDGCGSIRFTVDEDMRMQRGAAQNLLAQQPNGLALFNFPCILNEGPNYMRNDPDAFQRLTALLNEMGNLQTLASKNKRYLFFKDLPIYVEAARPRRFHQTIPFTIRGTDISEGAVMLCWRQVAERNPHATGMFRQNPIVKPGLLKVFLNDHELPEANLCKTRAPAGRIPSEFRLRSHEIVAYQLPGNRLRDGVNTLAFEMPKFPETRDPYVYIYEFSVDITFDCVAVL